MMFQLKGCIKCGGDLFLSYGDWQCMQCGKYHYISTPWSYITRREGAWGRNGRVSKRGHGSKKPQADNKSMHRVASV